MINKCIVYLSIFLPFSFSSCFYDMPENVENEISYKSNIVIESTSNLSFTDLINYKKVWYVAYRDADSHSFGTYSKIKILKSIDFINWTEYNSFEKTGWDLRDPKFSYNEITKTLFLHIHAANIGGKYGQERINYYIPFNDSIGNFKNSMINQMLIPPDQSPRWLWQPVWYNNNLLVGGYLNNNLYFYIYKDINKYPIYFSIIDENKPSESSIYIYNNELYVLVRRENADALLGKLTVSMNSLEKIESDINIRFEWNLLPFVGLGGPKMIIHNDIIYIAGRIRDKTSIYTYSFNSRKLSHLLTLPSYGDNSYPGLYIKDNQLYGIYYTQTENLLNFQINSFIIDIK